MFAFPQSILLFFQIGFQFYTALRLQGRPAPWVSLLAFTLAQTISNLVFLFIMPFGWPQFMLISATHIIYHMWIFKAELFPEVIFCYITPLVLGTVGEWIFPPLFATCFPKVFGSGFLYTTLGPSFAWTAFLPSFLVACYYFLFRDMLSHTVKKSQPSTESNYRAWGYVFLGLIIVLQNLHARGYCPSSTPNSTFGGVFMWSSSVTLLVMGIVLQQTGKKDRRTKQVIQFHIKQNTLQKSAIRALREERHDFLNELTLISTYIQIGKMDKALDCISYTAAALSDRYNYASLPDDAWLTVLEFKQTEAMRRRIEFLVDIQADPPGSFMERRLLPKFITNLVDNSFTAVASQPNPHVTLSWSLGQNQERILTVSNNGPQIPPSRGNTMFLGGMTTKKDGADHNGWGLPICRRIADELASSLTYESSPDQTSFILTLPPQNTRGSSLLVRAIGDKFPLMLIDHSSRDKAPHRTKGID